jgi:hypothetical protein
VLGVAVAAIPRDAQAGGHSGTKTAPPGDVKQIATSPVNPITGITHWVIKQGEKDL